MTQQVVTNHKAVANLAARLEQLGYRGDDVHQVAEHLALNLLADGYRRVDPPVPTTGPGATRDAIEAAKQAAAAAVAAARAKRTTVNQEAQA